MITFCFAMPVLDTKLLEVAANLCVSSFPTAAGTMQKWIQAWIEPLMVAQSVQEPQQ